MTISRIADLFSANLDSVQKTNARKSGYSSGTSNSEASASTPNSDAVKISTSAPDSSSSDDRSAKVAAIKAQVSSGTYRTDGEKVARSVILDLF